LPVRRVGLELAMQQVRGDAVFGAHAGVAAHHFLLNTCCHPMCPEERGQSSELAVDSSRRDRRKAGETPMSKPGRPVPDTHDFDREFRAQLSQMTAGIAPTAFTTAWADWAMHLAQSPSRRAALRKQALERAQDTWAFALRALTGGSLSPSEGLEGEADRRFGGDAWTRFPFNVYARAYQNNAALMRSAVGGVRGVTEYHAQLMEFAVRMLLEDRKSVV